MSSNARICIVVDRARLSAKAEGKIVWGFDYQILAEKWRKAGIAEDEIEFVSLEGGEAAAINKINSLPNATVLVPLDESPLRFTTGLKSISKWHLSPLDARPEFRPRKVVPTWHPDQVKKDWPLQLYVELALRRAREECETAEYARKPYRFKLNPTLEETHAVLDELLRLGSEDWLSVDIETGRGQINTVGFAWSISDAIAIQTLPERCGAPEFYRLWTRIGEVLRGPSRKVFQNGIYEVLYFARYGLPVLNFAHDTMVAQKFLWPEFDKGLDNVGRFYTREPYWKDSGRVESEEGKKKDWGAIRDWPRHFDYNCRDTSGTFEAMLGQRRDLEARGQLKFYDEYLMPVASLTREMCLRGLPVSGDIRTRLTSEYEEKTEALTKKLSQEINPRSWKQKLTLFKGKGYTIPKVRDSKTGAFRESVNEVSLKKMRIKHPDDPDIPLLLEIAEYEKALSSYFRASLDPLDGRARFMLDPHGTETGRFSCSTDAWSRGFNAQTIPKYAKKMVRFE